MSTPNYQAEDFLSAIQGLMPRGLVWPREASSIMSQAEACFAPTWARHVQANNNLLVDAFPSTTLQLLPEWESTLGLPDPCAGESPTIQLRRAQVVARLTNSGGQSVPYFVAFAESLGYDVSIDEFAPFRVGQNRAGDNINSEAWAFAWRVDAPAVAVSFFRAGLSAAGEPLEAWGNAVLVCEFNTLKPAHTTVIIANPGLLDSSFNLDTSTLS